MRERPLSPHLQVYRWPLSMALSILHRASGGFLALGSAMLVWWLMTVASGGEAHARFLAFAGSLAGQALLLLWTAALVYHLLNGVRHLAWDAGWGYGKSHTRATGLAVLAGTVVLTAAIWFMARGGAA